MYSVKELIQKLELEPHPEGGFYRETYRSSGFVKNDSLSKDYNGDRNYATCIYFLLTSDKFSSFHRIKQDEIWHFYGGATIRIHLIDKEGSYSNYLIGKDVLNGENPQFIVPGGVWFAAEVVHENDYSLVGCTVAPGFCFEDFELSKRTNLISKFPKLTDIITRLTHS